MSSRPPSLCRPVLEEAVKVPLDAEAIARIDALTPYFAAQWAGMTREDIVRALILLFLEQFKAECRGLGEKQAVDRFVAHARRCGVELCPPDPNRRAAEE